MRCRQGSEGCLGVLCRPWCQVLGGERQSRPALVDEQPQGVRTAHIDDLALGTPMADGTVDWFKIEKLIPMWLLEPSHKFVIHAKEGR